MQQMAILNGISCDRVGGAGLQLTADALRRKKRRLSSRLLLQEIDTLPRITRHFL
jgi:hypothetical protein